MTPRETCLGCIHRATRFRGTTPRSWCKRYKTATTVRCLDYRFKAKAIDLALRYVKQIAIK